jgi:hypothetical protein
MSYSHSQQYVDDLFNERAEYLLDSPPLLEDLPVVSHGLSRRTLKRTNSALAGLSIPPITRVYAKNPDNKSQKSVTHFQSPKRSPKRRRTDIHNISVLKNQVKCLGRENQLLKKALEVDRDTLKRERERSGCLLNLTKSMHDTWKSIYGGPFGEECKQGVMMTDMQYGLARNMLCKIWSTKLNRYVARKIPNSVTPDYPRGLFVPVIPNLHNLRSNAQLYSDDLGMRDCSSGRGAYVDARQAILFCLKEAGKTQSGEYQVQIIGDGHRAMKTYGIVNICARGLHSGPYFNALSTMNRM